MNSFIKYGIVLCLVVVVVACQNKREPNYQYMPNMYESVGYETYAVLPTGEGALTPPANTINRNWLPYEIENSPEGKEIARLQGSPLDTLQREANLVKGKELYAIYCAICHGNAGKGQGTLVKREKILGVPSYADSVRNVTVGSTFYTMQYGLNSMGSYSSQMNTEEMWQVSEYVVKLRQDLTK